MTTAKIITLSVFTLILVFFLVITLIKKNKGKNNPDFDERQVAARGKCSTAAFAAMFVYELILVILKALLDDPVFLQGPLPNLITLFIGADVFTCTSIMKDAYIRPSENTRTSIILFAIVGILDLFNSVRHIIREGLLDETGRMGDGTSNLMLGLFILSVPVTMLIKRAMDKKTAAKEAAVEAEE